MFARTLSAKRVSRNQTDPLPIPSDSHDDLIDASSCDITDGVVLLRRFLSGQAWA